MSDNPLLQISNLPNYAPPFNQITTDHYLPAMEEAIKTAKDNIQTLKNNNAAPDFENTIVALETATETLSQVTSVFYNQLSAMGGDALHELAEKIGPLSANFSSDLILDEDLFTRIKTVYDERENLDLSPEQQTLLRETYTDFVRGGALLDREKKQRLREISQELSVLGPTFMNNVSKSSDEFEMIIDNEADLSGLPDSTIEAAAHAATEKKHDGKWLFTLDYPSYVPFIQYADNRDLREKIWRAFGNRAFGGQYDNCENVKKIVTLRNEKANLIGYDCFADFVLERRMAETTKTVMDFLETMKNAYKPAAEKDLSDLKKFTSDNGGPDELKPWDIGYYSEKLKQERFQFSSEDFRPYFQLDKVLEGCFTHFSKLFDLTFKPADGYTLWHEDVKVFEVFEGKTGDFVGTLYGDFHPRTGKKPGAWKAAYRNQGLLRGKIERPIITIVCNFTKPTPSKPSLLTHGEVTTLFHEMGHAVHALLSKVTYPSLAGTSVLWDFVELPSQVQENWCYEKETLDLFAHHYETGEPIPEELITKLRASINFMVGWGGLRQTSFGLLDLAWHRTKPNDIDDVPVFEDKVTADTSLFPRLAGPMSCSFSHIFAGGYAAGYYSYKWAEVLDADTFEAFQEHGLYDQTIANAYKEQILSRGGSEHPSILYKRFRGRNADTKALLRREGLEKAS